MNHCKRSVEIVLFPFISLWLVKIWETMAVIGWESGWVSQPVLWDFSTLCTAGSSYCWSPQHKTTNSCSSYCKKVFLSAMLKVFLRAVLKGGRDGSQKVLRWSEVLGLERAQARAIQTQQGNLCTITISTLAHLKLGNVKVTNVLRWAEVLGLERAENIKILARWISF